MSDWFELCWIVLLFKLYSAAVVRYLVSHFFCVVVDWLKLLAVVSGCSLYCWDCFMLSQVVHVVFGLL